MVLPNTDFADFIGWVALYFVSEGQHLEYLGKTIRQEREEDQSYRLREQVALVACLLGGVQDDIQLPLPAVLELTNLLCRMQEEWKRR